MPTKLLIAATIDFTLEAFLLPFADHFRSLGWTVDCVASRASRNSNVTPHFDHSWEIGWSQRPLDRNNVEAISQIRRIVIENQYDIVHVHTPVASFLARYALNDLRADSGLKVVYTAHGFHCRPGGRAVSNAVFCGLERAASSWMDALVVINHEDERLARRCQLGGKGRVYYMPGIGIDLGLYSRANVSQSAISAVANELGLGPAGRLLLMVASFTPGKRHQDVLRAFKRIWKPDLHLAFAGLGPGIEKMKAFSIELGLSKDVHFLGLRTDIPTLLAAADALILPSAREGLPRSVMESMAMGTPVIGTRIRGTSELLSDGAGLLVELGDVEGLAAAMGLVMTNPAVIEAIVETARRRVSRYALPRVLTLHEDMYRDLLACKQAPPRDTLMWM